jgi:2-polyprenyl-3-methyl-5-hydroxy-6-metoxy-1,4-benzoquinol methylase
MDGVSAIDEGRVIDWGKTSTDYARHRPGPPDSFYRKLAALDVGLPGQRILDLGTGTGVLARQFARQGARVAGIDISEAQIDAARRLASEEHLEVDFHVAAAEELPTGDASFDVITANQCWLYFDKQRTLAECKRVLAENGLLVMSYFSWLPLHDPVAKASEELVLKFNPQWSAGGYTGHVKSSLDPPEADWLTLRAMFFYDTPISFTRESWRGRIRACRGIGASLSEDEVRAFDEEHDKLLQKIAPPEFTVLHRVVARICSFQRFSEPALEWTETK